GPFRQAVLDGVLDPDRVIQIGIRGGAEYLWEFSYESGMTVIHANEVDAPGLDAVIAKALAVIGDGPAYVSFDVDSLDPAFAPGHRCLRPDRLARPFGRSARGRREGAEELSRRGRGPGRQRRGRLSRPDRRGLAGRL